MDELDYERDLEIDPNALDIAALEQANLAMKYGKANAHYERVVKKADEKIKITRARLIRECNEDPEGCLGKGNKATAVNVEAYYREHPDHIQAKEEWIEAVHASSLAKAAVDAVSFQRKKMIEILAQLIQIEYFSGPSVPRDLNQEWGNRKKEAQENGRASTAAAIRPRRSRP